MEIYTCRFIFESVYIPMDEQLFNFLIFKKHFDFMQIIGKSRRRQKK